MPKKERDLLYLWEHMIYSRSHWVDEISNPKNVVENGTNLYGIPYPISRKLFELYNEYNQAKFNALIEDHRANYLKLKTALVQQTLHDEMVYNALPANYKKYAEPPTNAEIEQFYTFVKLTPELRKKGKKNGLTFREFLSTLGKPI